jgi:teichuronic acid biosynthesis glycosyltransferase TuaC
MKVLHITNNFPTPNFPIFGIFVKEQIDSLTNLGVENEVFFMNSRDGGKKEYIYALFRLRKHLRKNKYDIIHCHHSYSAFIFLFSGKIFGKKCVLSYQNDPEKEGGKFLFKVLYQFFDRIILKNKSAEINYSKTIYLPNGVNTEFFIPRDKTTCKIQLGLDKNKRYIIFMDSYNRRTQKRVDRFNETIKILKEKYRFSDLEPLILTNVKRDIIPIYLCASDLHMLTSDFEGSPNSVKECLACNVPVVSTPVGNVKELIGDVEGCHISKSFLAEELAELTCQTLGISNYSSRELIKEKGLDINTVARKLLNIYEGIINKN